MDLAEAIFGRRHMKMREHRSQYGRIESWDTRRVSRSALLGALVVASLGGLYGCSDSSPRPVERTKTESERIIRPRLSVLAVAAGEAHTCVITEGGFVKCWGDNSFGQLGLGDIKSRGGQPFEMGDNLSFVNLGTGLTASAITAGDNHTCVLIGTQVKCWGKGQVGQHGLGFSNDWGVAPAQVGDGFPFVNVGGPVAAISAYRD